MMISTLCYIENNGDWLMLLRNKKKHDVNKGKWIGVGGKLETGETPEEMSAPGDQGRDRPCSQLLCLPGTLKLHLRGPGAGIYIYIHCGLRKQEISGM